MSVYDVVGFRKCHLMAEAVDPVCDQPPLIVNQKIRWHFQVTTIRI